ncbi:SusD/RagB family nutrient-binding outer membrane lipoprotein [Chitinophaga sp.]|uniref:SusD/RagB family nutrient-binding outer membrane lipoprotein n=1 Tax=Chitinophaga sp. TaxID=1869181 RepID=UPI0031D15862
MKKVNLKIAILALTIAALGTGCSKFLDVNDNPNQPTEADVRLLLPSAQAATSHVLSNQYGIQAGIWGQYWTQSPFSSQYKSTDRYLTSASSMDRPWAILWSGGLQDYQSVINNAGQYTQQAAIAYILKAYTFQMLTDAFGDIPLSEALKGGDSLNVGYDPQAAVYDSIFVWLDKGIGMIDPANPYKPTSEDLIFGGDMDQWTRFGNTLKLRAYLRLFKAATSKAQAGIQALQGKPFLQKDARINYTTNGGNENPMFSEILGLGRTQNLVASSTAIDALTANLDPRRSAFYTVVTNTYGGVDIDTIVGIPQGTYDDIPDYSISFPSAAVGGLGADNNSAAAPVRFISAAESYFLQAEAVVRGWLTGNARDLFIKGIEASFAAYGLSAEAAGYIASAPAAQWPAGAEAQIKAIITQKYFAMTGNQTFEAWTEWRRTGYPDFFVPSAVGELSGNFPQRFPYPNSEATTNAKSPDLVDLDVPVWWAE